MAKRVLTPFNFVNLTSDPDTAASGDIYYNSDSDTIRYYDGEAWNDVGTGAGGGITVSETAPLNPSQGDAWFKESTNTFYIYDGTYWIEIATTILIGTSLVDDPDPTLGTNMSASGYGIGDIGYLDFDTNTLAESIESRLRWDSDFGTLSIGMEGGDVELPIGQKQGAHVKNTSGVNIGKGKAVQFAGAQGGKIEIEKAISDGTVPSKYMFGITAEAIDDDEFGFVVTEGYIRGINTSGLQIGDLLYFDPNTPGNLTATEPPSTAFNIPIAAVTFVNANAGVIYVRMNMEYELKEIEDIELISPQNGDVLVYNSASALWNNAPTVSSLIGTTSQINVSASTGAVTLSLPSTINVNTSGNAATATKLETARAIFLTGDITGTASFDGSASVGISATLANTAVTPASYGSASAVPTFTVDSKGRLTAASNTTIVIPQSSVTNLINDLGLKAADADVVKLAGTQTISGQKTFSATNTIFNNNVGIGVTPSSYKLEVNGSFAATTKSFDIAHPTKEGMRLRYGSLEGPELGVYIRGKSNSSKISLPEYWTGLVDSDSITVQLTPIGQHKNLYVKDISNNTVTIGGVRGEFEFFYFIQAERKDVEKLVVEYGS